MTETDYEKEQWYQEVLKNGRNATPQYRHRGNFSGNDHYDNVQKYLYMGREILDYSRQKSGS
ncbi:MAG: hypothetical protein ACLUGJ_14695 [Blautia wexlerae]